ncbi:succinate-semialdehyde dehydrogenase (NADP(+)) [Chromatiales bacterium (ex Bugula neritina AB1)]|nr:succinate-semialdehyde dehydrogenase (NADP(+)) [Chromatiales bacterium (ex Bugula neritina AB1)]
MTNSEFLKQANLINGDWVQSDAGSSFDVTNPANGDVIGNVPKSGAAETRRAIESAEAAFIEFRQTTANQRAVWLRKMHDVMLDNQDELAKLLTMEQGKPHAEAFGEIGIGAAYLLWFAEEARRVYGEIVPSPWKDKKILVNKYPVGVVAAITPWNFPSSMLARKIGPAIAAGCTSVVKPASQTPYSALAWGVIAEKAGLPAGVINIVTGSASEIGGEITSNPSVKKLTFTGSTAVGKVLIKQSAENVKKVSMELGGNAPFIVFDDADIDRAVTGAIAAKYRNSGQTCVCTNRFFIQSGVYDQFIEKFTKAVTALKVGNGVDDGVQQGPLIDIHAVEKIEELLADAKSSGATLVTGGNRHALGGSFYEPTIVTDVQSEMRIAREEIFGPVSAVIKFQSEPEVISMANDTEYGLACYCYTKDLGRAFRMTEQLQYGLVGINEGIITTPEAPFGGMKESGLGSEGGSNGIDEYLNTQYSCIGGLERS